MVSAGGKRGHGRGTLAELSNHLTGMVPARELEEKALVSEKSKSPIECTDIEAVCPWRQISHQESPSQLPSLYGSLSLPLCLPQSLSPGDSEVASV